VVDGRVIQRGGSNDEWTVQDEEQGKGNKTDLCEFEMSHRHRSDSQLAAIVNIESAVNQWKEGCE
jgi:hypothetical protein